MRELIENDPSLLGEADATFRHSGWATTRARVEQALVASCVGGQRLDSFRYCGRYAYVMESIETPGHYRIAASKCHDRFCKPCARERSGIVARNLLEHVGTKRLRFITLTLATKSTQLSEELDRLYKCFAQLRRQSFWRRRVIGGAALLEVKYNHSAQRWHPHFHVLVEGSYIAQGDLRAAWLSITGDSSIVDIRAVKDNSRVTRYITKYATDPVDRSVQISVDQLAEAIMAFQGRRSCSAFGSWHRLKLTDPGEKKGWKQLRSLNTVIAEAREGIENSQKILASLWAYTDGPPERHTNHCSGRDPPHPNVVIEETNLNAHLERYPEERNLHGD